ncbi:hypothetical protein M0804_013209 [Polistes exclamans]|nr:hypothetical protein M0804_013209 [Polistes exclamans]
MRKDEYLKEMEKLLEDNNTYSLLNKDPTNKFEKMANNLKTKLQNESIITEAMGKNLRSYNTVSPKLYGLRKTHKKECNMRPVVYVDDIVTAIPKDRIEVTIKTFNSVKKKIQFTIEVENNKTLPFLDLKIIRKEDGSILTDWYVKPTSSGRCLNFKSNHPISQKIGVVKGLLFRALTISSNEFHNNNKKKIEIILKNNNYPTSLIHMIFNKFRLVKEQEKGPNNKKIIRFPFIKLLSNRINKCFKNTNVKTNKTKIEETIRPTGNDSKPRNAQKTNTTALAEHHFKTGYIFKFDETKILDKEDNWLKVFSNWSILRSSELTQLMENLVVNCDSTLLDKMDDFRISDEQLYIFTGLRRENIIEVRDLLITMRNTDSRTVNQALIVFLFKLRTGNSNKLISATLQLPNEQLVSKYCKQLERFFMILMSNPPRYLHQ